MVTVDSLTTLTKTTLDPLFDNNLFHTILVIFLSIYAGYTAPLLPDNVAHLFQLTPFKLVILFLITYGVTNNLRSSLVVSVGGYYLFQWLLDSNVLFWAESTGSKLLAEGEEEVKNVYSEVKDEVRSLYDRL